MLKDLKEYIQANKKEVVVLSVGALLILVVSLLGLFVSGDEKLHIPEEFDDSERAVSRLMTRSALALNDSVEKLNDLEEGEAMLGLTMIEQRESIEDIKDDLQDMLEEISVMSDSANAVTPIALRGISSDMAQVAFIASEFMVGSVTKLNQIFNNFEEGALDNQDALINDLNGDLVALNQALRQYGLLTDKFNEVLSAYEEMAVEEE